MASAAEIKARINGVRDTKKITDAMYMISSSKMRRSLADLERTTPYFTALEKKIGELFHYIPETKNRYFRVPHPDRVSHMNHGVLLITSDKGLAGAYNAEAIKLCEEYMRRHPRTVIFIIGEYGRQYFLSKKLPFVESFAYSADRPSITVARRICADILEYYDDERLDEISIIYTDYMGARTGECKKVTLLPLEKTGFSKSKSEKVYEKEFLPSPDQVLDGVVPGYIMGFIYGCLTESYCSEQQARMNAMKSASDNAEEIISSLRLQYNKMRQAAITGEMIEITAGVKALKKKRTGQTKERHGHTYDT